MKFISSEASAPGRCGLLGNPSDIYGGRVLSCSVPARAVCRIDASDRFEEPEDLRLWNAASGRFPLQEPVSVRWTTEIPRSSGLSGSTALLAATLAALLEGAGTPAPLESKEQRIAFAELVRDIERHDAGIMCGFQDAYMICLGGVQLMNFRGKHPERSGPPAQAKSFDCVLPFLLVTTGVERLSGSVHGPMAQRWIAGEELVRDRIERISELAEPGAELLMRGDWAGFGGLMNRNQEWIRELGGSGEPVDLLVRRALEHGALGVKLAGAGMGGTVVALTEDADALEQRLRGEGYTRFMRPTIAPGVGVVR